MQKLYDDKDKYIKKIIEKFDLKPKWYHEFDSWDLMDYYEFGWRGFHIKENKSTNNLWEISWQITSEKSGKKISLENIYKILDLIDDEDLNKVKLPEKEYKYMVDTSKKVWDFKIKKIWKNEY